MGSSKSKSEANKKAELERAARQQHRREHILAAARNIASASSHDSETKLSVAQAKQLVPFRDEYRSQDPEFVNRFGQACVRLAACQENPDVFDLLVPQAPGTSRSISLAPCSMLFFSGELISLRYSLGTVRSNSALEEIGSTASTIFSK